MGYDPQKHHRRSIRLKGYDYTQPGAYFVTICIQGRECLLGEIIDRQMRLNDAGKMVARWWNELSTKFPFARTDEYVVMPNHLHGILMILETDENDVGADPCVCPDRGTHAGEGTHAGVPLQDAHAGIPKIVQWFKTMTTNEYIRSVRQHGWPQFPSKLWQRNYYEHIIRNEDELRHVRRYIVDNAPHWEQDENNPNRRKRPLGS